ncbi:MAG: hypothetical protein CMI54_07410 [Parcubacteria group bacterium]|nr:hypothetical protein [Parcubacteria group bacterium]
MANPYKYRDLFKPILNTAARAAYKMKEAVEPGLRKAQQSPYTKAYWDLASGKKGRAAQVFAIGAPIYAGSKVAGLVPERAEEVVTDVKKEEIIEPDKSILISEEEKKEILPEDVEISQEIPSDGDGENSSQKKDEALMDQSNMYMGDMDNESLNRIEGYKEIIRDFMGSGEESTKMQNLALLMQVGSSLMTGKTNDRGVMGFFDIIGKTGMQVAPMLFQMGVEKGKAEREIGAAALNLYMGELDKAQDRSGPFTVVYENVYERDDDGGLVYSSMGEPKTIGRRRVQTYYRKSPEIQAYMDFNNQVGFDKFTFVDSTSTPEGMNITGLGDQYQAQQETTASRDRKKDYASYVGKGIDVMADFIMPTIIANKDTLTGFWGEVGRTYGPKYAAIQSMLDGAVLDGMGGQGELDKAYNAQLDFMNESNYIVNRAPDQYKMINGKKIGFFVDEDNEYGFNQNPNPDGTGGEPTWLATTDGMTRLLTNPNRSAMITFENTLGLMLSRDRQPTGRMLADILQRSFADTQMTSFGFGRGAEAVSPYQVLSNYTFIFNQLAANRANALYQAGLTDDKNDTTKQYSPEDFKIKGIDKYVNAWYNLRSGSDGGMYSAHDIYGQPKFGAWKQSISGNIILDQEEDKKASNDIVGDTMQFLTQ